MSAGLPRLKLRAMQQMGGNMSVIGYDVVNGDTVLGVLMPEDLPTGRQRAASGVCGFTNPIHCNESGCGHIEGMSGPATNIALAELRDWHRGKMLAARKQVDTHRRWAAAYRNGKGDQNIARALAKREDNKVAYYIKTAEFHERAFVALNMENDK